MSLNWIARRESTGTALFTTFNNGFENVSAIESFRSYTLLFVANFNAFTCLRNVKHLRQPFNSTALSIEELLLTFAYNPPVSSINTPPNGLVFRRKSCNDRSRAKNGFLCAVAHSSQTISFYFCRILSRHFGRVMEIGLSVFGFHTFGATWKSGLSTKSVSRLFRMMRQVSRLHHFFNQLPPGCFSSSSGCSKKIPPTLRKVFTSISFPGNQTHGYRAVDRDVSNSKAVKIWEQKGGAKLELKRRPCPVSKNPSFQASPSYTHHLLHFRAFSWLLYGYTLNTPPQGLY